MRENLAGAEHPGARRDPGAPRRRRADAHLRRARPARGVRRSPLLRQGRVRGPAHDGPAHGGQEDRRARPRLRPCARGPDPAAPPVGDGGGASGHRRRAVRSDVATDVEIFTPPFLGSRVGQGHRRSTTSPRTSTRPRCSATSGSSGPTSRATRTTPSSRSASARPSARAARRGEGRGVARARGGLGLLPGQRRRQRPRRVDRRRPSQRAAALHVPAPAQRPPPLHRRLLPLAPRAATPTTPRSTW